MRSAVGIRPSIAPVKTPTTVAIARPNSADSKVCQVATRSDPSIKLLNKDEAISVGRENASKDRVPVRLKVSQTHRISMGMIDPSIPRRIALRLPGRAARGQAGSACLIVRQEIEQPMAVGAVSYTHLRAHETD